MDAETRRRKINQHLEAIRDLETQAAAAESDASSWPPKDFYLLWHVMVGLTLGGLGAAVSLLANGLAAPLFGKRALELIRVYLTFPNGRPGAAARRRVAAHHRLRALPGDRSPLRHPHPPGADSIYFDDASAGKRFAVATGIGLGLWIVNFYLILSWLQPMLLGGNWIVSLIPPWVGAFTHLAFAWTVAAAESFGKFEPYRGR